MICNTHAPDIASPSLSLNVHPMRSVLYEELHNRPSPVIEGSCQVAHFTVKLNDNRQELHAHVVELCRRYSVPAPDPDSSCLYQDFGGFELRWERHLEFANFTFIVATETPFATDALAFIPKDWLAAMPGELVVAVNLSLVKETPDDQQLFDWFEGQRVSGASVASGHALVWTAFRLHSDGFGRIVAVNRGLNPYQTGRLVQRLFELETYRLMSLLALPVARKMSNQLTLVETSLAQLIQNISELENQLEDRDLLTSLSQLAADVERYRSDTNFRFAAAKAYHDLVRDRLDQLKEEPLEGVQSLREFLERRLTPGIKTCNSVRDQLEDLSRRIHRTTSLLRTRVDLSIQEQNQRLLTSMDKRSELQLRLQQTVEGLSVVVICYYLLALIGIGADGLKALGVPIEPYLLKASALPVVLVVVFVAIHRLRHHLNEKMASLDGKSGTD
ncbi:DUF3422 family protein [Oceanobacter sp. 3_MG-2023]|uniref:DUF3422 family protein n=1 Tax=Oceanobacter sp. 3_MG-2023 TaxID=3062622 RepID=UPI002732F1E2|nr:DUF3422 domain-containing protein [Oceanobacter sp. 3_MG-2023]MDP2507036.1 DUF3422 domain-containing protein [Oceanobacter sp. 3_MG-2023]